MKVAFRRGFLDITLLFIIVVIVLGAVLTTGFKSKSERGSDTYVPEIPIPGEEKRSLQLQALKFKECSEAITFDLLLDRTGSMGGSTPQGVSKIDRLKEAVLALTNNLSDDSIIGIQSFSSVNITEDVPISYYKDIKALIPQKVNSYQANGDTPTHDALAFSLEKLRVALPKFSGRKFNFILVSDGQPVPSSQDPRLFIPNPADEIKNLGVNVYTVGIFTGSQARDPKLAELLKSLASKPENYYVANTADDTKGLLATISEKICQAAQAQAEN